MWFYIALATSLVSAVITIFNKRIIKDVNPTVVIWFTLVLATPIIFYFAIKEGIPNLSLLFFVGVLGSDLLYTTSRIIQLRAMKLADLSAIYPLISLGPIFTLVIASLPPLSEKPGPLAIVGVLITLVGAYLLNIKNVKEGLFKPIQRLFENKASVLMIISVILDSVVIIFDKMAIKNTIPASSTFVLLIENILIIMGLFPILLVQNKDFVSQIKEKLSPFIIIGVLNAISTLLAFSAVGTGSVAIVATILKVQLFFVLLFSFLFFKDKPKIETIVGSLIMILGVILIKIGL